MIPTVRNHGVVTSQQPRSALTLIQLSCGSSPSPERREMKRCTADASSTRCFFVAKPSRAGVPIISKGTDLILPQFAIGQFLRPDDD